MRTTIPMTYYGNDVPSESVVDLYADSLLDQFLMAQKCGKTVAYPVRIKRPRNDVGSLGDQYRGMGPSRFDSSVACVSPALDVLECADRLARDLEPKLVALICDPNNSVHYQDAYENACAELAAFWRGV